MSRELAINDVVSNLFKRAAAGFPPDAAPQEEAPPPEPKAPPQEVAVGGPPPEDQAVPPQPDEAGAPDEQGEQPSSAHVLAYILGALTALRQGFHSSHWQSSGPSSYSDHLLFERLYNSVSADIDTLGEKLVAMYGGEAVAAHQLATIQANLLTEWSQEQDPFARNLTAVHELQDIVHSAYDAMKVSGELTLGMDDFLMSMANSHETTIYLLQQRLGGRPSNAPPTAPMTPPAGGPVAPQGGKPPTGAPPAKEAPPKAPAAPKAPPEGGAPKPPAAKPPAPEGGAPVQPGFKVDPLKKKKPAVPPAG